MTVSHERLIIGAQLELLGKLLLSHVEPLVMHVALVSSSSQISWQMILKVDHLCHVFHLVPNSLTSLAVSLAIRSERANSIREILILWSRALKWIEVELILVRSPADAPLV